MQMRLFPQEVFTSIWDELSTEPMQPPLNGFRHLADLAIAQLPFFSPNFLFIEQVALSGSRSAGDNLRLQLRVATWFQGPNLEQLDASLASAGGPS